jgi:hypothetical protein
MDLQEPLLVSVESCCRMLSIGRSKCYLMLRDGTLESRTIGRRRLILRRSILRIIDGDHDVENKQPTEWAG